MNLLATVPAALTTLLTDVTAFLADVQEYQIVVIAFSVIIALAWRLKRKS